MSSVSSNAGAHPRQAPCDQYNATITEWTDVADDLAMFRVTPDAGPVSPRKAGQFATIGLPKCQEPICPDDNYPQGDPRWNQLWRRPYSVASPEQENRFLEFFIVLNPVGKFTPKLWALRKGGRVNLAPKVIGEFNMDAVPEGSDIVMVCTGTGLSPFMSMIRTYSGTGRWNRCVLIQGARYQRDLGYVDELRSIAAKDKTFTYVPAITREPDSDWQGFRGRVNTILEDDVFEKVVGFPLTLEKGHVMLCGNPVMIQEAEQLLNKKGWVTRTRKQPGNLHFERFW